MIFLTKGQILKDNPGMVVYDPTGYYNDGDSVICASVAFPDEPVCRYEAKFVAYGGMVYSISNPDDLMAEILKLDPASLFGKNTEQIAVDKMVSDIVPQESGEVVTDATTEVVEPVKSDIIEEIVSEVEGVTPSIETGDSSTTGIIDSTSSSTPVSVIPEVTPSDIVSTTSSTEVISPETVSTTPAIEQSTEVLTTTDNGL